MRVLACYHSRRLHRLMVWWQWEPRDCWVGCFWTTTRGWTDIYVCLLPCLPLHLRYFHRRPR